MNVAAKSAQAAILAKTPLAVFYRPTRRPATNYPNIQNVYNRNSNVPVAVAARTDYASNAGGAGLIAYNTYNFVQAMNNRTYPPIRSQGPPLPGQPRRWPDDRREGLLAGLSVARRIRAESKGVLAGGGRSAFVMAREGGWNFLAEAVLPESESLIRGVLRDIKAAQIRLVASGFDVPRSQIITDPPDKFRGGMLGAHGCSVLEIVKSAAAEDACP